MTARVNIVINYEENKVEVFKFLEADGVEATEREALFAASAMTMIQKLDVNQHEIEPVLDLGATIEFCEEDDDNDDVCISILDNGRHNVLGGSQSLSYRIATSVVEEMKRQYPDHYDEMDYEEEDYWDDELAF